MRCPGNHMRWLFCLPVSQHFYYHCRHEWLCDTGETPHEGTRWLRLVSLGSSETILRFRSAATVIGCLMSNKGTGWSQFPFSLMTCTQCVQGEEAFDSSSRNAELTSCMDANQPPRIRYAAEQATIIRFGRYLRMLIRLITIEKQLTLTVRSLESGVHSAWTHAGMTGIILLHNQYGTRFRFHCEHWLSCLQC